MSGTILHQVLCRAGSVLLLLLYTPYTECTHSALAFLSSTTKSLHVISASRSTSLVDCLQKYSMDLQQCTPSHLGARLRAAEQRWQNPRCCCLSLMLLLLTRCHPAIRLRRDGMDRKQQSRHQCTRTHDVLPVILMLDWICRYRCAVDSCLTLPFVLLDCFTCYSTNVVVCRCSILHGSSRVMGVGNRCGRSERGCREW